MDKKVEMRIAREWQLGYERSHNYWVWSDPEPSLAALSAKYAAWVDSHPGVRVLIRTKGTMAPAK